MSKNKLEQILEQINSNFTANLSLCYNEIGDQGAKFIADALIVNKSITDLSLCYNEISDQGAKFIADVLEHNTSLRNLDLGHNEIGDQGVKFITNVLTNNYLITGLFIEGNKISNEVRKEIVKITNRNEGYLERLTKFIKENFVKNKTIEKSNVSELIKPLKLFQQVFISKFKTSLVNFLQLQGVDKPSTMAIEVIKKVTSYTQDNWFELKGICKDLWWTDKYDSEAELKVYRPFKCLPKELVSYIASFIGDDSLLGIRPTTNTKLQIQNSEIKNSSEATILHVTTKSNNTEIAKSANSYTQDNNDTDDNAQSELFIHIATSIDINQDQRQAQVIVNRNNQDNQNEVNIAADIDTIGSNNINTANERSVKRIKLESSHNSSLEVKSYDSKLFQSVNLSDLNLAESFNFSPKKSDVMEIDGSGGNSLNNNFIDNLDYMNDINLTGESDY